ncbi:multi-sensor signal transduction histidine kinase [Methanoregula boonei 6A8]|uniref:histidine kinase n=1 Tax=Methanoregula boonei (strain DSM 21154 / JCM 14090 / 6A8) TaxID=456442 RepID=A7I5G6_METB6|nr:PAS domain S-box protein [Methanoregula boonei]ABS54977.1 multi-sensor signal transduction histidine kinase [Methanoregula boonei 6A8]
MIRVLYVDDEPNLLDIGRLFLEATGEFSLDTAVSAQEGLAALEKKPYDAVVSDFQMPGMDGIEFLKMIRSGYGHLPFILFTGRGREEVVIKAIDSGTDFYVQKGGDPRAQFAELAHKIRQAVGRRSAEILRIASEKRLADIINFLPDATFAIDPTGTVIAWNRAIEELTGIPSSDMVGKGNYEYSLPLYGERRPILIDLIFSPPDEIGKKYAHIVRDGTMLAAETELPRVRGKPRILWGKAGPLYDQNGQVTGAIESIRDITDRKKAEQRLAEQYRMLTESTSRLRRAEEVARIGHWELHLGTGTMSASENAAAIYGVDTTELPIAYVLEIPLPEYRQALNQALDGLVKRGEPYRIDFRIRRPLDGTFRDIHSVATYDPEKQVVFGIIQDITERKKIETDLAATNEQLAAAEEELRGQYDTLVENQKALAASEEQYRAILDNIQDIYYRTDKDGTLIMLSPSGALLLGYANTGEMIGRPATDYYADPAQRDLFLTAIKKEGVVTNQEITLKRKDKTPVTVSTSSHAYLDAAGRYAGVEGIFRDISDIRKAQRERETAYEQLAAAEEELRGQYEELARSEQQLRDDAENFQNLVTSAPDAIYISIGERFVYVNPAMVRLLGAVSADQLIGMSLYDRIAPQYRAGIHERARIVTGEHKPVGLKETVYLKMDGTPVPVESSVALFRYRNQPAGLVILRDITEYKKAERARREQEKKYRVALETTGTGFVILDSAGKVLDANQEYIRLTGHQELGEIAGRTVTDWTAGYHKERNAEAVRQCLKDGFVRNIEIDYTGSSGIIIPVEINASVIPSVDGIQILALCRDITERRKAESAIRESEKKYRDMFEINNAVMFIVDPVAGRIVDANAAACRYYGYSRQEFAGLEITKINVQDTAKTKKDMAHAQVEQGAVFRFRHLKKSGEIRDVEVYSAPVTQEGHQYLHSIIQDVTSQRQAEEALRESEEKFRDIFNNTTDAIQLHEILPDGTPGRFTDVNDIACRMLGYTRDEILARSPQDITTAEHNPPREKIYEEQRTRGQARFETEFVAKDGTVIPVEINTRVVTLQKKKVILAIARDITERKRAEMAIRQANRMLNLLTGITRHDIGNQLTALFQYIDLSKMMEQNPEIKSMIEKEEFIARNIRRQIDFTREYGELGAGNPVWQEVCGCVEKGIQGLDLTGKEIETTGLVSFEILADPLLQKVFFNLVDNALRHGGPGLGQIRFSSYETGSGLMVVCEDDGTGIPHNQKELIFERGYGKNTGFGLFFIREILAITGITIRETGEPGRGARFEMLVPPGEYRRAGPL